MNKTAVQLYRLDRQTIKQLFGEKHLVKGFVTSGKRRIYSVTHKLEVVFEDAS